MRTLASLSLAAALLQSPAASALTEYCVGTPGQLQNALDQAEIDGDDSLVKLRSGTWTLTADLAYEPELEWVVPAGRLTVRGGYNADCSSYSLARGATTLQGNGHQLRFETVTGPVSLAGITVVDGDVLLYSPVLSTCPAQKREFNVRRLQLRGGLLDVVALCHDVAIENSLLADGSAPPGSGVPGDTALAVYLAVDEDQPPSSSLRMSNSTVVNGRVKVINCCDGRSTVYLYNNVFDRPAGAEIFSEANVLAVNNRYDGLVFENGAVPVVGSANNVSANPQLGPDQVPVAGSPMINSGTANQPGGLPTTDLAGGERVVGAGVDRGALESPVDGTGVYTVTNGNAGGTGSLAWAVDLANQEAGSNTIRFDIPGGCPRRIALAAPLQVRDTVLIDGWSQPGSTTNTSETGFNARPCVILDGGGTIAIGIEAMGEMASGARRMTVRGLAFEGFALAMALPFGSDHAVQGNQFGGRVGDGGPMLSGNQQAIGLIGGGRTRIGGWNAAARNLIGGSSDVGVLITTFLGGGGDDNEVINNLIGLDRNGVSALPNGTGIRINGGFNRIAGNRIAGNTVDGILLSGEQAEGNRIEDNLIGAGAGPVTLLPGNGRMGVMVQSNAHDNVIGPGNTVARNGDDGIRIMASAGGRNTLTANHIARNDALGIDLGANGVTANDPDPSICDPDLGCPGNRGQNFPVLTEAERRTSGIIPVGRPIRVAGTLRSVIGGPYTIEVFGSDSCDANGHGEGRYPLASVQLTLTNAPYCPPGSAICIQCQSLNCTAPFSLWLPELDLAVGDAVTATATSPGGDTSEFSACRTVGLEVGNDLIFADGFED